MTYFDDWLDGRRPASAPMHIRRAIEEEQEGRIRDACRDAGDDRDQMLALMHVADNWGLVLDMLTMLAMDGVYGRNQEERIASLLILRHNWSGGEPEADYNTLEAVLARFRTHVVPEEVCP